jgi:hypothetical protein
LYSTTLAPSPEHTTQCCQYHPSPHHSLSSACSKGDMVPPASPSAAGLRSSWNQNDTARRGGACWDVATTSCSTVSDQNRTWSAIATATAATTAARSGLSRSGYCTAQRSAAQHCSLQAAGLAHQTVKFWKNADSLHIVAVLACASWRKHKLTAIILPPPTVEVIYRRDLPQVPLQGKSQQPAARCEGEMQSMQCCSPSCHRQPCRQAVVADARTPSARSVCGAKPTAPGG